MSSTKDPKTCSECGLSDKGYHYINCTQLNAELRPTPQASQVWVGDNPPDINVALSLANAPQATKPVDEQIDYIFRYVGDNGYHENRGARVDCGNCKNIDMAKSRVQALISNQVASAVKEALEKYLPAIDELVDFYGASYDGNPPNSKNVADEIRSEIATLNGVTK